MSSSMTALSRPTPAATLTRLPVGTCAPAAMTCADAEVYIKGTTVLADRALSAFARPNVLGTPGARCWSPPV